MNRSSGIRNVYLSESINYREEYDKTNNELIELRKTYAHTENILQQTEKELEELRVKYNNVAPWSELDNDTRIAALINHTAYSRCQLNDEVNLNINFPQEIDPELNVIPPTTWTFKVIGTGTVGGAPENSVTLMTKYLYFSHIWDGSGSGFYCIYAQSDIKQYLDNEVFSYFPVEIQNAIVPLRREYRNGEADGDKQYADNCKCWLMDNMYDIANKRYSIFNTTSGIIMQRFDTLEPYAYCTGTNSGKACALRNEMGQEVFVKQNLFAVVAFCFVI